MVAIISTLLTTFFLRVSTGATDGVNEFKFNIFYYNHQNTPLPLVAQSAALMASILLAPATGGKFRA